MVAPDVLLIAEEFAEWEDPDAASTCLVCIAPEIWWSSASKRGDDGGHMDLQAVRYAAMVSRTTFEHAVDVYQNFLDRTGAAHDARTRLLEFLEWDEPHGAEFAPDVRIVLVSADFSRELTTAVLWLNEHQLDVRCVRLKPYDSGPGVLIDAQTIIPLPEASDYQEKVRHKAVEEREARREDTELLVHEHRGRGDGFRVWEDSKRMDSCGGRRQEIHR